jgi:hypothetical protein
MEKKRAIRTGFWWGSSKERDHLKGLSIDGKIPLKDFLNKWYERNWTILEWLKIETISCEQSNEPVELLLAFQGDYFI